MSEYYEDSLEEEIAEARNTFLESLKNPDWTNKKAVLLEEEKASVTRVYGESAYSIERHSFKPGEKWVVDDVNSVRFLR